MKLFLNLLPFITIMLISNGCKKEKSNNLDSNDICATSPFKIGTVYGYTDNFDKKTSLIYTKDTIINSKVYFKNSDPNNNNNDASSFHHIASDGQYYVSTIYTKKEMEEFTRIDRVVVKTKDPIGTTWSYNDTYTALPGNSYKTTYKIVSKNETFTLNGKAYKNGIKIEQTFEIFSDGVLFNTLKIEQDYFCGLGFTRYKSLNLNTGQIYTSTLTAFTY